ncbi:MAG: hypothetical protein BWY56_01996 [Acidobacteria bacterium ADurb.Bin340]|nr:MAG: hypothetical protein BWY56_01996 [Acidobacteria bacterium ADurb.Bin340]
MDEVFRKFPQGGHAVRNAPHIAPLQGPSDDEAGPVRSVPDQFMEALAAQLEAPGIGILAVRQHEQPDVEALGQRHPQRLLHGPEPGGIPVEAQHQPLGEAPQLLEMGLREGRPQRRHRARNPLLLKLEHIEIALHHQGPLPELALGPVEPEEHLALAEERRFPRIQVLGFGIAEGPAPKGDESAPGIVDGDGEPIPEEIDLGAPFAAGHEPRLLQQLPGEPGPPQVAGQGLPCIRRIAEARFPDEGFGQPAALQVVHGLGTLPELRHVEGLGRFQR